MSMQRKKPQTTTLPPAKELEELGEKHFRFLTEVLQLMPRIEIQRTDFAPFAKRCLLASTVQVVDPAYAVAPSFMPLAGGIVRQTLVWTG